MKRYIKIEDYYDPLNRQQYDTYYALASRYIKENKDRYMKDYTIVDYKVCENDGVKTVVVEFSDGTEEHAVCCKDDEFELSRGIEVCVMKHLFGTEAYKTIVRESMKQVRAIDRNKKAIADAEQKEKELIARKKAKAARRKERTRENRRKRRIAEMSEAYFEAMKLYGEHLFGDVPLCDSLCECDGEPDCECGDVNE